MRLISALAASAAVHAGLFLIPAGELALNGVAEVAGVATPLQVRLAEKRLVAAADEPPAPVAEEAPEPVEEKQPDPGTGQGLGVPIPYYYSAKEVGERARPIGTIDLDAQPLPDLPDAGLLVLVLFINESGAVDKVDIESSSIASATESAIADQFRQARFTPAIRNGFPVKSRMKIEVAIRPPVALVVPPPPPRPVNPASAAGN